MGGDNGGGVDMEEVNVEGGEQAPDVDPQLIVTENRMSQSEPCQLSSG